MSDQLDIQINGKASKDNAGFFGGVMNLLKGDAQTGGTSPDNAPAITVKNPPAASIKEKPVNKDLTTWDYSDHAESAMRKETRFDNTRMNAIFPNDGYITFWYGERSTDGYGLAIDYSKLYRVNFTLNDDETMTLSDQIDQVVYTVRTVESDVVKSTLTITKNAGGGYSWAGTWSNNLEDRDKEIISKEAHEHYVKLVNDGVVPAPQLWIAHNPAWKIGTAETVALDTHDDGVVFVSAKGTIDNDKSFVAKWFDGQPLSHSHGMIYTEKMPDDASVYKRYITSEISVLPVGREANIYTGFASNGGTNNKEVQKMAFEESVRNELVQVYGATSAEISFLESLNASAAVDASAKGVRHKAEGIDNEDTTDDTAVVVDDPEAFVSRGELAELLTGFAESVNKNMVAGFDDVRKEIKAVQTVADANASLSVGAFDAILKRGISAVGAAETRLDGRTVQAKSKPEVTETETQNGLDI